MIRLFSWELSYFSGKVRAYLRYKERMGALEYEDILATPNLVQGLLLPKSGSVAVPQVEMPGGGWVQDSTEIIDACERLSPDPRVTPDPETHPRQAVVSHLLELFADEWMVVPGFWERWYFSEDGRHPSHRKFNELQWGSVFAAGQPGAARKATGAMIFEQMFGISESRSKPRGVYAGLRDLGADEHTEAAWQASQHRVLGLLETHFGEHDYVLGGRPSLGDFALLGPLYAHLYRDAVSGFALRSYFPLVCEWVERTNGEGCLTSRSYGQQLYSLGEDGALVGRPANTDDADWLPDDEIPPTLLPLLGVFFDEMWPVLQSSIDALCAYLDSDAHTPGAELPGKTFTVTPGFEALQSDGGPLTHAFEIGGIEARRMVVPYQVWQLGRVADVVAEADTGALEPLLSAIPRGKELLDVGERIAPCRVRKEKALLYAER